LGQLHRFQTLPRRAAVAAGLSDKGVGKRLSITEGTAKNHVHNALEKLHMENRIQAAAYIVRQGLGRSPDED
jgi:Response regulator containing a CheY-like receiver domain and an HTH DNA-binding domain